MGGKGKVWWWIVVALFLLAFLWFVPQLQGRYFSQGVPAEEIPALVNEYRRTWAQILGGAALLSGLYFTWRTLQANREGQLTERFTRAIDQLGATDDKTGEPRLALRLGGIYALERIDKESPERAYHRTVMEVLTAYIREASRRDRGESSRPTSASNEAAEQDKGVKQNAKPTRRSPPADIQAILTVLSRRHVGGAPKDGMAFLVLRGANLEGTELQSAKLQGANFEGTNLQGARLEGTNLQDASLQEANLRGAYLRGARLLGARLQGADLQEADLRGADLRDAKVTDEQLADTRSLQGATMPDGQKYEEWLTDKEGSGKDMENQ